MALNADEFRILDLHDSQICLVNHRITIANQPLGTTDGQEMGRSEIFELSCVVLHLICYGRPKIDWTRRTAVPTGRDGRRSIVPIWGQCATNDRAGSERPRAAGSVRDSIAGSPPRTEQERDGDGAVVLNQRTSHGYRRHVLWRRRSSAFAAAYSSSLGVGIPFCRYAERDLRRAERLNFRSSPSDIARNRFCSLSGLEPCAEFGMTEKRCALPCRHYRWLCDSRLCCELNMELLIRIILARTNKYL
jgi:hypothetical protein